MPSLIFGMNPRQWQAVKDEFVACKPGPNPLMWDRCSHNYWMLLEECEKLRGMLSLLALTTVNQGNPMESVSILLGWQDKARKYLNGGMAE